MSCRGRVTHPRRLDPLERLPHVFIHALAVVIGKSHQVHAISIAAIGTLAVPVDRLLALVLVVKLATELFQLTYAAAGQRRVRLLRVPEHRAHAGERVAVSRVLEMREDRARDVTVGLERGAHVESGRGGEGRARGVLLQSRARVIRSASPSRGARRAGKCGLDGVRFFSDSAMSQAGRQT
eukprot:31391-Pelagococcus_subviridis.AAC.11